MFAPEAGCGAKRPPPKGGARQGLVAILTAMPEEFEAIARVVSQARRRRVETGARGFFLEGKIAGARVLLVMTGDGAVRAETGASSLLASDRFDQPTLEQAEMEVRPDGDPVPGPRLTGVKGPEPLHGARSAPLTPASREHDFLYRRLPQQPPLISSLESPVSFLVGAGAAGALVPSLRAGEVIVGESVLDEAGEAPPPDAFFFSRAVALGAKPATVVTLPRLSCSSKEKMALASRFGFSDAAPAVVDTESAAWARAAAGRGVPWLVLRAVSDTFEDDLPPFLSSCLAADGSVDRAAVARRLVLHPAALPVLLRARERVREGAARVGDFLGRLLSEKI